MPRVDPAPRCLGVSSGSLVAQPALQSGVKKGRRTSFRRIEDMRRPLELLDGRYASEGNRLVAVALASLALAANAQGRNAAECAPGRPSAGVAGWRLCQSALGDREAHHHVFSRRCITLCVRP